MTLVRQAYSISTVLVGLAVASCLQAGNLAPACIAGTLAHYEALTSNPGNNVPFECSVGILNYTDFTSSGNLNANDVEVTPEPGLNGLGGGFALSPLSSVAGTSSDPFRIAAGNSATYIIDWLFIIDAGPVADGASLGMDPPFGDVTITQNYCTDSFFTRSRTGALECTTLVGNDEGSDRGRQNTNGISAPQSLTVSTLPAPGILDASLIFSPPALVFASVDTVITITGDAGAAGSGFDSLTGSPDVIPPVPEPGTFVLFAGALAAVGFLRKRQ
jgi:hypothetical protein